MGTDSVIQAWDIPLILGAYLVGSVPFAYLIAKAVRGIDIREVGSGNVGATNVGRALGRKWGILVFALDVLKGFLPTLAALLAHGCRIGEPALPLGVALTGFAAVAGHNWPVFLKFKGGKGMATSCGVFLAVFPLGLLIALGVWAATVALTRYVSVGSMVAAAVLLISALFLRNDPFGEGKFLTVLAAVAAVLSIVRHRSNIGRLIHGTENRIGRTQDY
jgi:acyl phosphate:glycerol-3-phosphate acyltransferase